MIRPRLLTGHAILELYDHIQKLPYSWHVKNQTGDIIQRCTSDVDVVRNFVTNQLMEVFRIIFLIVFYMVIIQLISHAL